MAYKFATIEEIQKQMKGVDDEFEKEVMQNTIEMIESGLYHVLYNEVDGKYFAVVKGNPIPTHLADIITGKQ